MDTYWTNWMLVVDRSKMMFKMCLPNLCLPSEFRQFCSINTHKYACPSNWGRERFLKFVCKNCATININDVCVIIKDII